MKVSLLAGMAASALVLAATQASAADVGAPAGPEFAPYISLFAGASFPQDIASNRASNTEYYNQKSNTGYLIGGALGMNWNGWARTEIELSHSNWGGKSFGNTPTGTNGSPADVNTTYLLGNVWLDWKTGSAFTPYIGGGLGVAWVNFDEFNAGQHGPSGSNSVFAYQLGAGVNFAVSDQLSLDVGYRYKATADFEIHDGDGSTPGFLGAHLASHNVQIGLTYQF